MTNQLTLRQQVDQMKPEFAKTLPVHLNAEKFTRDLQTVLNLNPELSQASPKSIFASALKAASDGLSLDGREAALVIRNVNVGTKDAKKWEKQATYLPMVQGLMKLARNSGQIASMTAQVVYANDQFTYSMGDDERIEHIPAGLDKDQGKPIAVYAIAKLKDGTVIREVMRGSQVLKIGAQGSNGWQYDPERGPNFAEWWRKTALRRIAKYIPRSTDREDTLSQAIERIDEDYDYSQAGEVEAVPVLEAPKRVSAAEKLKAAKKGGATTWEEERTQLPTDMQERLNEKAAKAAPVKAKEPEPVNEPEPDYVDHDPDTGEIDDSLAANGGGEEGDEF